MFILDGKSLFGNSGLILSICILLILLYFSYNKCYINNDNYYNNNNSINEYNINNKIEKFELSDTDTSKLPISTNVRAVINGGTISLNFTLTNIKGVATPSKFIIVLAQYDNNKKNTGNNKFYVSNEYALTSSVDVNKTNYQTNVCSLVDNLPSCSYTFTNLDISSSTGTLFYYKVGVSAVYDNGYNTPFVIPYNISTSDKLFSINASIDNQSSVYTDFLEYQNNLNKQPGSKNINSSTIASADGKYELIKSQLGNYPDNLLFESQNTDQNLLNDLVDKSMVKGIVNVNIKI